MITKKLKRPNLIFNKKNRNTISLKRNNHLMSKRVLDVLKLNLDIKDKKFTLYSKSTDYNKKAPQEKKEENNLLNPLILSSSIKQVKNFLPNINTLLNTESDFNYNPTRQEHLKFEEKIKNEISYYTKQEKNLKNQLDKIENKILLIDNEINDSKIEIEALKTLNVNDTSSILRKVIVKKCKEEFNKEEEENMKKKYTTELIKNSPSSKKRKNSIFLRGERMSISTNPDFNIRLNIKLKEQEKLNKEKTLDIEKNMKLITNDKENTNIEMNEINEKLKSVRYKKKILIEQLYNHYLNILKEGKDSRKDGLAWIIMEIFYLNKKILLSNFPKYLDIDSIHYLLKMANLNIKISQLENKVKDKKENLNKFLSTDQNLINNIDTKEFFDDSEENHNIYEYSKKQLSLIVSKFSRKLKNNKNKTISNFNNSNSNNFFNLKKESNNQTGTNFLQNSYINNNNEEKSIDYLYKKPQKKVFKILDMQKYYENNISYRNDSNNKEKETLNSDEFHNYSYLTNELILLKRKRDELKIKEMDRIFKMFQRNNYEEKYHIEKSTVINALVGEDNLESELFKQEKREREYMHKINSIHLYIK